VSCTGQGEVFIRRVAAYDVAARMIYGQQSLQQASDILVHETLASHGIGAGMIVLGAEGNPHAPYNTLGMYRGWIDTDGRMVVATHHDLYELGDA
jgi:beta-aspartyl-peptidase (threonine type)